MNTAGHDEPSRRSVSCAAVIVAALALAACATTRGAAPTEPIVDVPVATPPAAPRAQEPIATHDVPSEAESKASPEPQPKRSVGRPDRGHPDVDPALHARIASGRPYLVVVEVEVQTASSTARVPVGSCSVVFDLWYDVYSLQIPGPIPGPPPIAPSRTKVVLDEAGVVSACTDSQAYAAALAAKPPGSSARRIVRER